MDDGTHIRQRREELGLSQAQLADEVGTRQQTIDKIERGLVKFSRYLPKIEARLGLLTEARQQGGETKATGPVLVGERDLPVYGAAEGGEGVIIVSSDPVDYVRRPAPLAQVKDGYAIIHVGDSMVPAFEPGDLLLVHPHLPPVRDCDVALYGDDHGHELVTVKRLVRFTATEWHLRQWNPAEGQKQDFSLSRRKWPKCHRIVGKYSRR